MKIATDRTKYQIFTDQSARSTRSIFQPMGKMLFIGLLYRRKRTVYRI